LKSRTGEFYIKIQLKNNYDKNLQTISFWSHSYVAANIVWKKLRRNWTCTGHWKQQFPSFIKIEILKILVFVKLLNQGKFFYWIEVLLLIVLGMPVISFSQFSHLRAGVFILHSRVRNCWKQESFLKNDEAQTQFRTKVV
jgi:hypothetical protein